MAIIVNLDIMMARRKISLGELAEKVDITPANLSILKTGKAKAIRFSTLEAICKELDGKPVANGTCNQKADETVNTGIYIVKVAGAMHKVCVLP